MIIICKLYVCVCVCLSMLPISKCKIHFAERKIASCRIIHYAFNMSFHYHTIWMLYMLGSLINVHLIILIILDNVPKGVWVSHTHMNTTHSHSQWIWLFVAVVWWFCWAALCRFRKAQAETIIFNELFSTQVGFIMEFNSFENILQSFTTTIITTTDTLELKPNSVSRNLLRPKWNINTYLYKCLKHWPLAHSNRSIIIKSIFFSEQYASSKQRRKFCSKNRKQREPCFAFNWHFSGYA